MTEFHVNHGGNTQAPVHADSTPNHYTETCAGAQPNVNHTYTWKCTRPQSHTGVHEHTFFGATYGRWYTDSTEI